MDYLVSVSSFDEVYDGKIPDSEQPGQDVGVEFAIETLV